MEIPEVDLRQFLAELYEGVTTVEELRDRIRPMLEDEDSSDYVEPGVPTDCSCGQDLRHHLQAILDIDEYAMYLVGLARGHTHEGAVMAIFMMSTPLVVYGPEDAKSRGVGFIMYVDE